MEHQEENRKGYKRKRQSPLPIELTSEILLRLPQKSVARSRCVSKLWLSITTDPYFINLFLARSPPPSLLLIFRKDDNLFVSSIPQHTHSLHDQDSNKAHNSSSQLIDSYHMKLPEGEYDSELHLTESVHGLICFRDLKKPIVLNPSKKQFITLTNPRVSWKSLKVFLGYDPVEGKHKVMCLPYNRSSDVCRVLTLGVSAQDHSWRTVKTNHKHRCDFHTIGRCINGVIYYVAYIFETRVWVVMSFDVRSEKFDMIPLPLHIYPEKTLITFQGMIACVGIDEGENILWVLEDAKKHKWSSLDKSLSPSLYHYSKRLRTTFTLRGFTHAGEFVFVPDYFTKSAHTLFWDPVTKQFRKFKFKHIAEGEQFVPPGLMVTLDAFPNHIESQISL